MNKKGFTLIELIGSIVILAVIAIIAFPAIINTIKNSNDKIDEYTKRLIISAANEYVNDNIKNYTYTRDQSNNSSTITVTAQNGKSNPITVSTLCSENYLNDNICNNPSGQVTVTVKHTVETDGTTGEKSHYYRYDFAYNS